ncbi:MAG: NBR1-Ig-like domain-containing protein [Chloroflexota bacterium]|nr:NBR1-Ig-like domain-containing protein [Chloroflexota bacterium]
MHKNYLWQLSIIGLLLFSTLACTLGNTATSTETPATLAAETTPLTPSPEVVVVTVTSPPPPTDTPAPDVSDPGGCTLNARYVADVTVPDDTEFAPGTTFHKVWRVRNSGTCTWEAGLQLLFVSGESLGGPAAVAVPAVAPGANTDIGVDLAAPATPGTYRSTWQLQTAEGVRFGNQIYVQIVVPAAATNTPEPTATGAPTQTPTATSTPATPPTLIPITLIPPTITPLPFITVTPSEVTINFTPSSTGQVDSGGSIHNPSNAGDTSDNLGLQGFLTFDVSSIPDTATITSVKLNFTFWDTLGDPFGGLGCLRAYYQNYGGLDAGDYTPPPVMGSIARFCSEADLSDTTDQTLNSAGVSALQSSLAGNQFQIRLQFNEQETNGNNTADVLRPTLQLEVAYQP